MPSHLPTPIHLLPTLTHTLSFPSLVASPHRRRPPQPIAFSLRQPTVFFLLQPSACFLSFLSHRLLPLLPFPSRGQKSGYLCDGEELLGGGAGVGSDAGSACAYAGSGRQRHGCGAAPERRIWSGAGAAERRIWSDVVVLTVPCPATPRRRRRGVAASSPGKYSW